MNKSLLFVIALFFVWSLIAVLSGDSPLFKETTPANTKNTIEKNGHITKRRLCKNIAYRQAANSTFIESEN